MAGLIINFENEIHNLYERMEYHLILNSRYIIITSKISIDVLMHIKQSH